MAAEVETFSFKKLNNFFRVKDNAPVLSMSELEDIVRQQNPGEYHHIMQTFLNRKSMNISKNKHSSSHTSSHSLSSKERKRRHSKDPHTDDPNESPKLKRSTKTSQNQVREKVRS